MRLEEIPVPKFNVNFSDSTYCVLADMSTRLDVPMAEVLRESLSVYWWLVREVSSGSTLLIQRGERAPGELVIPYLERLKDAAPVAVQEGRPPAREKRPSRRRPTGSARTSDPATT
jgi:hypothetical protein